MSRVQRVRDARHGGEHESEEYSGRLASIRRLDRSFHLVGDVYELRVESESETDADGDRKLVVGAMMQGASVFVFSPGHILYEGFVEVNADGSLRRWYEDKPTGKFVRETWTYTSGEVTA